MNRSPDLSALACRFDSPGVQAVILMGSFARGDAGPYSDVDLLRLVEDDAAPPGDGSHLVDGWLVVVSNANPAQIERWFTEPHDAVSVIAGLRDGRALIDRHGVCAALQARARSFRWDDALQAKADAYAGEQLVGWIEEVHKALQGLQRNDVGRLLNARFGLSWGLADVVRVQRGLLTGSDNAFYDSLVASIGVESEWAHLLAAAFGVTENDSIPSSLYEEVIAGLQLYEATVELLHPALLPEHLALIEPTVARIRAFLKEQEQT